MKTVDPKQHINTYYSNPPYVFSHYYMVSVGLSIKIFWILSRCHSYPNFQNSELHENNLTYAQCDLIYLYHQPCFTNTGYLYTVYFYRVLIVNIVSYSNDERFLQVNFTMKQCDMIAFDHSVHPSHCHHLMKFFAFYYASFTSLPFCFQSLLLCINKTFVHNIFFLRAHLIRTPG